ncbi:MAG TPA: hypothetical protein VFB62_12335, partial [Polyangiaceae bacterium]|nr:hypothetical protein [Polyangiaceae bacterium]
MKKSLALFVALVCWLASCSSDPETSGPSATVGTGGGAASGGQAGAGGSTDACEACVQQDCADELDACLRHPACANWAQCIQPCDADADPAACLRACNDTYNGVAVLYEPVYQCACASCDAACPNHDACNQKCVDDLALPLLTTPPALLSE